MKYSYSGIYCGSVFETFNLHICKYRYILCCEEQNN